MTAPGETGLAADWAGEAFSGAKMVLLSEGQLAVIRRDAIDTIPWPGHIDLPGGARDGEERPETCALRETAEEIGLTIATSRILWSARFNGHPLPTWVMAARITPREARALRLGDEGQACWMMPIEEYLTVGDAIPHQQERVRLALSALGVLATE